VGKKPLPGFLSKSVPTFRTSPLRQTQTPHLALERPQQTILDPARMALRQMQEKRLCLQFRSLA
jgi:hypothetical protein